jgi:hypothetical protein
LKARRYFCPAATKARFVRIAEFPRLSNRNEGETALAAVSWLTPHMPRPMSQAGRGIKTMTDRKTICEHCNREAELAWFHGSEICWDCYFENFRQTVEAEFDACQKGD